MTYEILDIPEPADCKRCVPCMRIRLMEMGLITGEKIELDKKRLGLYLINVLTDNNIITSTIALREEEFDRLCLKEI
jgi:Fe2+ transport system protein FeoA